MIAILVLLPATVALAGGDLVLEPGDSATVDGKTYHCDTDAKGGIKLELGDRITRSGRRIVCVDGDDDDNEDSGSRDGKRRQAATSQAVAAACDSLSGAQADRDACVRSVLGARFDATTVVDACKSISDLGGVRLMCVKSGAAARHDPSTGITGCLELSSRVNERLACISHLTEATSSRGAAAVKACREVSSALGDRVDCVQFAVKSRGEPEPLVKACIGIAQGGFERNRCLKRAVALRKPEEAISYCIGRSHNQNERLYCLDTYRD